MLKDIRNNKDLFDDKELPEGHLDRFEALLDKHNKVERKPAKRIRLSIWFSAAASVAVIVVIASIYYLSNPLGGLENNHIKDTNEFYTKNEFYKQQMNQQIQDIMCKLDQTDPETREELQSDLQKVIKENNIFINELKRSKDQEKAIFYMVQHYDRNIQALEFINSKLGKFIQC